MTNAETVPSWFLLNLKVVQIKVLPSKLDRFPTSIEAVKKSLKNCLEVGGPLFGETISANDLYYFVSVNELR